MLKICEPKIFPIAISVSPFLVATTEVNNSGRLVPIATIVRPINFSLIPNIVAISTEPLTTKSPPNFNPNIPISIKASDCKTVKFFSSIVVGKLFSYSSFCYIFI